jgi:hypothetical protein
LFELAATIAGAILVGEFLIPAVRKKSKSYQQDEESLETRRTFIIWRLIIPLAAVAGFAMFLAIKIFADGQVELAQKATARLCFIMALLSAVNLIVGFMSISAGNRQRHKWLVINGKRSILLGAIFCFAAVALYVIVCVALT